MFQKQRGTVGTVFLKSLQIPKATIFVDKSILVEFLLSRLTYKTDRGNILYVDLDPLPRILHLFIGFCNIFWIRKLYRHPTQATQHAVQTRDRSGVTALAQLDPKHHQAGVRVPAAHIPDELQFCLGMLPRMTMWAV
jgi:hypothetical protein